MPLSLRYGGIPASIRSADAVDAAMDLFLAEAGDEGILNDMSKGSMRTTMGIEMGYYAGV